MGRDEPGIYYVATITAPTYEDPEWHDGGSPYARWRTDVRLPRGVSGLAGQPGVLAEGGRGRSKSTWTTRPSDQSTAGSSGTADGLAAVHVMSGLYRAAMKEHPPIVLTNPFAQLNLPVIEPRAVDFYEPDEAAALYAAAGAIDGKWRTMIELGMQAGLRLGGLTGLHGHRVDWLRGRIEVIDVMTRRGLRQWPKSKRSHRVVPVPPGVIEAMSVLMAGRDREALVFPADGGGPVSDENFRNRVWYPAVEAAGVRRFAPRVMRHTAASWLVQDGVPLYDVQALLGHASLASTQRYAHLAPDAHGKVIESWARRLGVPVAHGTKRAGL